MGGLAWLSWPLDATGPRAYPLCERHQRHQAPVVTIGKAFDFMFLRMFLNFS